MTSNPVRLGLSSVSAGSTCASTGLTGALQTRRIESFHFKHSHTMEIPDIHLDIGCGAHPRNPYGRNKLCGVDIRDMAGDSAIDFRVANLVLEPIPFAADSFGSVSAFDFIEHVPRILACADGRSSAVRMISYNVREALRLLRGRPAWQQPRDSYSHFLWELEAVKPPAQP
jgi:hypothetical protein